MNPEEMKILKMQRRRILLERRIRNNELHLAACDIKINKIFDIKARIKHKMQRNMEKHR